MNFTTEIITPQKAWEYLATSQGNRPISKASVSNYATTMKKGEWLVNGQCIIFDNEGHLLDGHHRLNAVIAAKMPVTFGVLRDVYKEAFTTIDCGLKRTAGQILSISGVKNYNTMASIVAASHIIITTGRLMENNGHYASGKMNNSDKYTFYMTDPMGFEEACEFARRMQNKSKVFPASWTGAIYYFLTRKGNYEANEVRPFFETLFVLDSSVVPSAALLRKKILTERLSGKKMTAELQWALTAKAWNFYIKGKNPKSLSYRPNKEEIPHLVVRLVKGEDVHHGDKSSTLAQWAKKVMSSNDTLTTTQIAKEFGMTAKTLNMKLREAGVQFFQSGQWLLHVPFSGWNLAEARTSTFTRPNGSIGTNVYTVWTERGRYFLHSLYENNFDIKRTIQYMKQ